MNSKYIPRQGTPPTYLDNPYAYNSINVSPTLLLIYIVCGIGIIYNLIQEPLSLPPFWALAAYPLRHMLPQSHQDRLESLFGSSFERLKHGGERIYHGFAGGRSGGSFVRGKVGPEGRWIGGLYNTGNTCYQNSVLQAMASLGCIPPHLTAISPQKDKNTYTVSPSSTLQAVIRSLNTQTNRPHSLTVPTSLQLNNASSWFHEQQDAQEFFQKLTGALGNEATKTWVDRTRSSLQGLETIRAKVAKTSIVPVEDMRSPFEGLLAQRVGCLGCGYVEAIRMQGFTSMSLALPSHWTCTIEECLNEFTSLETLTSVPCEKCTLLAIAKNIKNLLNKKANSDSPPSKISVDLQERLQTRLDLVEDALRCSDFSPKTLQDCHISTKSLVNSNKTKQIMVVRLPRVLVLHLNRSMFDMVSGGTRKNYASLRFDPQLDLEPWTVGDASGFGLDPARPMRERTAHRSSQLDQNTRYVLRSVVAHYGSHGNGHYICFRQTFPSQKINESTLTGGNPLERSVWWRCSDVDVRTCELEEVLGAGNAFMMFYERISDEECQAQRAAELAYATLQAERDLELGVLPEDEAEEAVASRRRGSWDRSSSEEPDSEEDNGSLEDETPEVLSFMSREASRSTQSSADVINSPQTDGTAVHPASDSQPTITSVVHEDVAASASASLGQSEAGDHRASGLETARPVSIVA